MDTKRSVVVATFDDRAQAEQAIDALRRIGLPEDAIAAVEHERDRRDRPTAPAGNKMPEGAGVGAAAGTALAGLAGVVLMGPTAPIGLLVYGGLLGAALGANAGGLVGAFVGMGIPEYAAKKYTRYVEEAHVVVLVETEDRQDEIADTLARHGGWDIARQGARTPTVTRAGEVEERYRGGTSQV